MIDGLPCKKGGNFPALFYLCVLGWLAAVPALAGEPPVARQQALMHLLRQDCGSCHGLTLSGGLGLPLTPEALRDKSPDALRETILHGRGGTPMPPWRPFMNEEEADWLVQQLLKGLPDAR